MFGKLMKYELRYLIRIFAPMWAAVFTLCVMFRVTVGPKLTGSNLYLEGNEALEYVRLRDMSVFESARGRLARQKQYLNAFVQKIITATKEDIGTPVNLYKEVSKYMTTDITADQVVYLTSQLLNYSFGEIYTLEGETIRGEKFEEFYPDYDKLKELMLQVFYTPVEVE